MYLSAFPSHGDFSFLQERRVLVTGAAGFIGSALCRTLLSLGAQVVGIDLSEPPLQLTGLENLHRFEFHQGDMSHPDLLAKALPGTSIVFNLAGKCGHLASMEEPLADMHSNGVAQLALLEGCRQWAQNTHVIFASTRQVYGRVTEIPVNESQPPQPLDVNGIHKMATELLHLLYSRRYGIPATIIRLTNTYGPGMNIHRSGRSFLGEWLRMVLQNKPLVVLGSGQQLRDLNAVEDVVDAFLRVAQAGRTVDREIFNLGGSNPFSLNELAQKISSLTHGKVQWRHEPFSGAQQAIDIGDYWGDYRKIRSVLGWEPVTDLRQGLQKLLETLGIADPQQSHPLPVATADGIPRAL